MEQVLVVRMGTELLRDMFQLRGIVFLRRISRSW